MGTKSEIHLIISKQELRSLIYELKDHSELLSGINKQLQNEYFRLETDRIPKNKVTI